MAEKNERAIKVVAENRKARFNYAIEDTIEAGLALTGTEVKSIRSGKTTIAESYADSRDGEIWLINANIPEYLIDYRISPGGMTASNRRRQLMDRLRIQLKYFELFNRHAWIGIARTIALMLVPVKRKLPDTISDEAAKALRAA